MFDLEAFSTAILNGELDDRLDKIQEVIKIRRELHGRIKAQSFSKGDRVKFVDSIRPQYLAGIEATIQRPLTKKFVVDLDAKIGRFWRNITVSPELIEKVIG